MGSEWGFGFEYPYVALLGIIYFFWLFKMRARPALLYVSSAFEEQTSLFKRYGETLLHVLGIVSMLCALASPVAVLRYEPGNRNGYDISLVLDTSLSMSGFGFNAKEGTKTKFDSAKMIVSEFIAKREGDNLALVVFGDYGYIASPLTYERSLLSTMVDETEIAAAGENTAIGDGLMLGLKTLEKGESKERILILLTDGKNNRGHYDPLVVAHVANQKKVKLYTIGMGAKGDFDESMLTHIAQISGGKSFTAYDHEALKNVYEEINKLEKSRIKTSDYAIKEPLYMIPLVLSLLFLGWYRYIRREG